MRFISYDSETGGRGSEHSLLTCYFRIFEDETIAELILHLKPNDGNYIVQPEALKINKIDLIEHDKIAMTYSCGMLQLENFLREHSDGGEITLIPVGQNLDFDNTQIFDKLISPSRWRKYCGVHKIELLTLSKFAQVLGHIPETQNLKLSDLCKYFELVDDSEEEHSVEYDVELNIILFQFYRKLLTI
jgi:hypothetical protein